MKWEEARDEWARRKVTEFEECMVQVDRSSHPRVPTVIEVLSVDFQEGETYSYSEYTEDHTPAGWSISYLADGEKRSMREEADDFGTLVREILEAAGVEA